MADQPNPAWNEETREMHETIQKLNAKIEALELELGKREYAATQLEGTIASLEERIEELGNMPGL